MGPLPFLTNKNEKGMLDLQDCFERIDEQVKDGNYPSCEESMAIDLKYVMYSAEEFSASPDFAREYKKRAWTPGMQESLFRRKIRLNSKKFELLVVTRIEDRKNKIDIKYKLIGIDDSFSIIQVKGRFPKTSEEWKKIRDAEEIQMREYGKKAALVVVGFREYNPDLMWFEYKKDLYSLENMDIMLQRIWEETNK